MSIGSVGSITASPMQHSLSVHSQPSSIPINDQSIISPHQNDVSPHPLTPILENSNINNVKTEIDDLKAQNSADMNNKHEQQQTQTSSGASDAMKISNGQTTPLATSTSANAGATKSGDLTRENLLKRPALMIQDCENNNEEDFITNQSLYDYSTWDAWWAFLKILKWIFLILFLATGWIIQSSDSKPTTMNVRNYRKQISTIYIPDRSTLNHFFRRNSRTCQII